MEQHEFFRLVAQMMLNQNGEWRGDSPLSQAHLDSAVKNGLAHRIAEIINAEGRKNP